MREEWTLIWAEKNGQRNDGEKILDKKIRKNIKEKRACVRKMTQKNICRIFSKKAIGRLESRKNKNKDIEKSAKRL